MKPKNVKRLLVPLLLALVLLALCADSCGGIGWTSGTPLSPCKGPDYDPGYLGAHVSSWDVTVQGTPTGYTDTSGTWDPNTAAAPYRGEVIQYGGYEYRVLAVHTASHTMAVKFVESC